MATLTLTLSASDIKKAVKSDTYITGQIDKSADSVKNAALAYNEAAGDDSYHEVKIYRTMKGAVAKFEANMVEYVDPGSGSVVADTLSTTTADTTFYISIPVGSRFYAAFADTLSVLAQEYIINIMLYTWWQSIKPALAKDYYQFAQESLIMVTKTLSKTPPETSMADYTDVTGEVAGGGTSSVSVSFPQTEYNATMGSAFTAPVPNVTPSGATLTYTSSDNTVATVNASTGAITIVGPVTTMIRATMSQGTAGTYQLNVASA